MKHLRTRRNLNMAGYNNRDKQLLFGALSLFQFASLMMSFLSYVADIPSNCQQDPAIITSIYNHQENTRLQGKTLYSRNHWYLSI